MGAPRVRAGGLARKRCAMGNAEQSEQSRAHAAGYRPEIDGLRAVAVLAVALFHGELGPFGGGFVGVDVFFVISGFLITGIIWRAIEQGRFSLAHFYERRIRRILPALMAVVLVVILFTLLFKTPREARSFGESISFLGLFASNFFFLQERGYFAAPLDQFTLLHTWSLAVEEQFYIVFPLLLMALGAFAKGRVRLVVWALTAVSFFAAAAMVFSDAQLTFFAAPFRFWELSLGAVLAIGAVPALTRPEWREAASAIGLGLIAFSVFSYDETTLFPGLAALPPCLGTALIIHANADAERHGLTFVGRGLAWGPMVFIGLASYSFYLWHWPALSFAQYVAIRPLTPIEASAVLIVSFGLAVASLYWIERPFRQANGVMARRPLFIVAAACLLGLIGLGVFLQESKGWPGRLPSEVVAMTTGEAMEFGVRRDCLSEHDRLDPAGRDAIFVIFCRIGDVSQQPKTLLWGDSHALGVSPAFDEGGKQSGKSVVMTSRAACPPMVGYEYYPTETWAGCVKHNQAVLDNIERLGIERVLLFATWGGYANRALKGEPPRIDAAEFEARLRATIEGAQARGADVVIGTSVPVYRYSVPSTLARVALFGTPNPIDRSRETYDAKQRVEREVIDRLAAEYEIEVFPLHEALCDERECAVERGGLPLYSDHGHLNVLATRPLGGRVAPLIR